MALASVGGGGGGFDYVQDAEPTSPSEGEEWFDTGANEAYVYDGAGWLQETNTSTATAQVHSGRFTMTAGSSGNASIDIGIGDGTKAMAAVEVHRNDITPKDADAHIEVVLSGGTIYFNYYNDTSNDIDLQIHAVEVP
jgi:hypothetical protein